MTILLLLLLLLYSTNNVIPYISVICIVYLFYLLMFNRAIVYLLFLVDVFICIGYIYNIMAAALLQAAASSCHW